ncbi:hypothetical protein GGX14DRAFT_628582 [Mycena pura]|uniref:Uncharacterized protein n=1 Tax=Mycena pura TaxID=153505 RepID=A0AAD6YRN4_9AGAR|nr:hypothetical protein GGX14DRAFT_628582 [Mycena pura]
MNNPYASSDSTANPFASSSPYQRYPDINDPAQFTQWLQPTGSTGAQSPTGFPSQQQAPFQQQPFQPQMHQFSDGFVPQQGFAPQSHMQFQPTSSFGQHMAGQMNGYGPLQTAPASREYNPVQQQLQNPSYVAQFDPYGSVGPQSPQQQPGQGQPSNVSQTPTSPAGVAATPGQLHPREYIRAHKSEVESWDAYAWKQLLNTFEALKDAWEARKKEIHGHVAQLQQQMQYGGYYAGQIQQEVSRLQAMAKDAESNHDSVAASSFQMHEVFTSYRQSADAASKSRVREASNAAITGLPDWPPLAY